MKDDAAKALDKLADVDISQPVELYKLQQDVKRFRELTDLLEDILTKSQEAQADLTERDREAILKEVS